jgi:5-formyltetrahydrofolate cyclo-ligase
VRDPAEIAAWRRAQRERLIAARAALSDAEHERLNAAIDAHLIARFPALGRTVGLYWPVRREFDPRPFAAALRARGADLALPVVVERRQPLEFRRWQPGAPMAVDALGIPHPVAGDVVVPDVLLVPVVGFDAEGFRLGYGGGLYDRTLGGAAKPRTIGIGFELGRLATIYPQGFDVALDAIVTEAGVHATEGAPDLLAE